MLSVTTTNEATGEDLEGVLVKLINTAITDEPDAKGCGSGVICFMNVNSQFTG
jgi:hypothetical protein